MTPDNTSATLYIRPVRLSDIDLFRLFLSELSPGTVYFRFGRLSAPALTDEQLRAICDPDHNKLVNFVALHCEGTSDRLAGTARMELDESGESFEFSIVVADDLQRTGLGKRLMHTLIGEASRRGSKSLYGEVLPSNAAMVGFCQALGFELVESPRDIHLHRLKLDLTGSVPNERPR
jgi:acetyltransferase